MYVLYSTGYIRTNYRAKKLPIALFPNTYFPFFLYISSIFLFPEIMLNITFAACLSIRQNSASFS